MDYGLDGKSAVVCAASRGLGRAVALGLARERARVTICARNEETLRATAAEIASETGAEVLAVPADVADPAQALTVIERARERFGRIDVLVTNAGGPPPGGFADTDIEGYDLAHRLTLMSVVRLVTAVAPEMRERKWGRIVNLTSLSVKQPIDNLILSNTARTAVIGFAKTVATELAPDGVTVNNVCPGLVFTDRIVQLAGARSEKAGTTPEEALRTMGESVPMGRLGDPAELANVVVFLASECASYVTGTTIQVDGGAAKCLM